MFVQCVMGRVVLVVHGELFSLLMSLAETLHPQQTTEEKRMLAITD